MPKQKRRRRQANTTKLSKPVTETTYEYPQTGLRFCRWYVSLSVGSVLLVVALVWVLAFAMLMCRKRSDAHGSGEWKKAGGMFVAW